MAESRTRLIASVRQILDQGFIPLLLGDAVFDVASGPDMLSGDAPMYILAMSLDAVQRCVFVTGVAGIYTKDLEVFDDATLVRQLWCISPDTDQGACDEPDATGATSLRPKQQCAKVGTQHHQCEESDTPTDPTKRSEH
ncbi:hypothetical protein E4U61_006127 [Claviceps capensis]|nr:hypothetical protein E4U61_006127 [Claviceps capensis]